MVSIDQIAYKTLHSDGLIRVGEITLKNGKKIKTPINWMGLSVAESVEFQQTAFNQAGVTCFLSNVYDLKYQDKKGIRRELIDKLVKDGLFHKVDSGGFQLMKQELTGKKKFELNPEIAYNIQKELPTDIGVVLDVPLGTSANERENLKKIDKTIENFKALLRVYNNDSDTFTILPVIHGHNHKTINYAIKKIEKVIRGSPSAIGIGSLVPMVKSVQNSGNTGGKKNFVNIIQYLRKELPNTFIHAFGIGGTMAYLAYLCGIDSIDSSGWILKASRGVIQLPGVSDRFLNKKPHNRPYLVKNRKIRGTKKILNEIELFMECECPVCEKYYKDSNWSQKDWDKKRYDFDQYTEESRMKRVIHNLWLYQNELKLIKEAIKRKQIIEFIQVRLQNSIYKSLVQDIIEKDKDQTNLTDFC